MKIKVLLGQLGSPKSPSIKHVRAYLKEFLSDPRVVDLNPFFWKLILYGFVLPFRPKKSARAYSRIWDGKGFPLVTTTNQMAEKLNQETDSELEVESVFLLSYPRVGDILNQWEQEDPSGRAQKALVLPLFPQYSESTTASVIDNVFHNLKGRPVLPSLEIVGAWHRAKIFIDESVLVIEESLKQKAQDLLIISFHGIPTRRVTEKKDPYYQHCCETFHLIKERIKILPQEKIHMTFQSRFGSEEWLQPYTDEFAMEKIEQGQKKIAVYCAAFLVDCLETTDEIGHELGEEAKEEGGEVLAIPCLNQRPNWLKGFGKFIEVMARGSQKEKEDLFYSINKDQIAMPEQKVKSNPLSPKAKGTIKIIFLTLFLDIMGFSIIFPLFPALAKYYLETDGQNFFLQSIMNVVQFLTPAEQSGSFTPIVIFGGILGAIYSFLQFLTAPLWGKLSDKWGRRPILLVSNIGIAFSYLLWIFSGSFTLLILARFIGGIMGGNISTATAVVGDVTDSRNRSKGMAFVGIAFALGFIFGPALGGLFSQWDLLAMNSGWESLGVNPFSGAALVAFLLSSFNVVWVWRKFKETLAPENRGQSQIHRSANPLKLFAPLPFKGINLTNYAHFLFLMAFSGMEFTLTFLAVERLSYSSLDNGLMFVFIGVLIALVQGGVVRRKAAQIGEQKLVVLGLILLIPGLLFVGKAHTGWLLYTGLFFLSVGAAMVIPCLTALASLYAPSSDQGQSLGIFRSLGALSRVIGPLLACWVYWSFGSAYPYYLGAAFLIIPIFMVRALPRPSS